MLCPKCNNFNDPEVKFCIFCGTSLEKIIPVAFGSTPSISKKGRPTKWLFLGLILLVFLLVGILLIWIIKKPIESRLAGQKESACEKVWQEILSEKGRDYSLCLKDFSAVSDCKKPAGIEGLAENVNILVILDSSGSMAQKLSGERKIDVAKEVIKNFIDIIPDNANAGLIVYGHKGSNLEKDKALSCAGIEEIYSLGNINKQEFKAKIETFQSKGWTPIASALLAARNVLEQKQARENVNLIYLVSDGEETCGGNPIEAVKEIKQLGTDVMVNVIGFGVDDVAQRQLLEIAQAGEGEYFSAKTTDEMRKIFGDYAKYIKELETYETCLAKAITQQAWQDINKLTSLNFCLVNKHGPEGVGLMWSLNSLQKEGDECAYYVSEEIGKRDKVITELVENTRETAISQTQENRQKLIKSLEEAQELIESQTKK